MCHKPIRVIVVDDHPLFRRGVVELLNDSGTLHDKSTLEVIAEYDSGIDLLDNLPSLHPDILLLDLQMPGFSGLELLQQIRKFDDELKVIIITACEDQEKMFEALKYGANGYLQKDTPPDEILQHLLAVKDGKTALNADAVTSIASQLRQNHDASDTHITPTTSATHITPTSSKHTLPVTSNRILSGNNILSDLTERERETLFYIARGLNNKLIARQLGISDGTVKVYVKNLLRKLNMHSRLELAAWAHTNLSEEELNPA